MRRIQARYRQWMRKEIPLPEGEGMLAPEAAASTNCWVTVRVHQGQAVIEDVFVAGQSLRDFASGDAAP